MKKITTLLAVFITLLVLQSCSPEELEPQFKAVPTTVDYTDAMMRTDSISNNCDTDPPKIPTPPIKL